MELRTDPAAAVYPYGEVAMILGVSVTQVRNYVRSGQLGCYRLGRSVRVSQAQIDLFLLARAIPASLAPEPQQAMARPETPVVAMQFARPARAVARARAGR
jgi:excisionase family DNA binding protein